MEDDTGQPDPSQPVPTHQPGQVVTPGAVAPNLPVTGNAAPQNQPANTVQPLNNTATPAPIASSDQQLPTLPASPPPNGDKKSVPKSLLIALVVFVVLLLGAGAYAYWASHHKVTTTKLYTGSTSKNGVHATVTAPVTTTVNCGSETCFASHFQKCTPATLTAAASGASVKYQIYSKKGNGCSMLFEYTANPNPAWVNQPMTCNFDTSQDLDKSVSLVISDLTSKQNSYGCSGPLVAILQSQ